MKGLLSALALAFALGAAAQEEVPFVVTPDRVTLAMLELAAVGPKDHLVDLGSGDGRIVITAARRFGASGLGVEIVPELVQRSRANARAAGVAERAEFREQDLFETELARASVVTLYLLPEVNLQLRDRLLRLAAGTRVVSHDWDMGDWQPDRSITIDVPDKAIGREKLSRVHLWVVPARVHGRWCSGEARIDVVQRFQRFSATLYAPRSRVPVAVVDGTIAGTALAAGGRDDSRLVAEGDHLRIVKAAAPAAALEGRRFVRCGG